MLSLLLIGMVPVLAQPTPTTTTTTTTGSTTTTTSQATTSATAQTLIQLAQAAQAYAQQVLSIAQAQAVNTTKAQALMTEGGQLLTGAQSAVGTNNTQAAKDALGAMKDFKQAAQLLQTEIVVTITIPSQVQALKDQVARLQNTTNRYQTTVNTLCAAQNASASTCSDARSNLALASAALTNATTMLKSITSASTEAQLKAIATVVQGACADLQKVATDINTLTNAARDEKGVQFVQSVLDPRLTQIQQLAQNSKLNSTQLQTIDGQLTQAQGLLTSAVQSFQAGNFKAGTEQSAQATGLMVKALHEIAQDIRDRKSVV